MWTDGLTARRLFFTGKGGVGKTSLACATALHLARQGKKTLIVSTDPASNLDEVFGVTLGPIPTAIPSVDGLFGSNLDPEAAAAAYREKIVAPYRGRLPDALIRSMEEQFSGACTTEIAAFDEFVRLMSEDSETGEFDAIVFDTAPTGHTLRLLSLPSAWSGYLEMTFAENSCLGPLAGLKEKRGQYEAALASLADGSQTQVVLVARPEEGSLKEAARTQIELAELGISNLRLVVNGVYQPSVTDDPVAAAFAARTKIALASLPQSLQDLPLDISPLLPRNILGIKALEALIAGEDALPGEPCLLAPLHLRPGLDDLIDQVAQAGHGVLMTMGKGGVGKTTCAALIALGLAERGHSVLLTTTDPAGNVMDLAGGDVPGLEVARIDPEREVARYTESVVSRASADMDEEGIALLREDLRSPCTEEIAVFRAFAEAVDQGTDRFVVIDTAPTGHTILLMDATESYHREVARTQSDAPESVRQLLPRLRDPDFTKVILVALPEPTPVHEAAALQEDLRRAGIQPYAWIVNRSLLLAGVREPLLAGKAAQEADSIKEVMSLSTRAAYLPWTADPLSSTTKVHS